MHQRLLKEARLGASFDSVSRQFHILHHYRENLSAPLEEIFFCSVRSVAVFLRLYEE